MQGVSEKEITCCSVLYTYYSSISSVWKQRCIRYDHDTFETVKNMLTTNDDDDEQALVLISDLMKRVAGQTSRKEMPARSQYIIVGKPNNA